MVVPVYPPHSRGGGGRVVKELVEGLVKRGHHLDVISGYYPITFNEKPFKQKVNDTNIYWIPLFRLLEKLIPQLKWSLPPNPQSFSFLKKIRYENYDAIHFHGYGHLLIDSVNRLAHNPRKILTIHGFPKFFQAESSNWFLYQLYRLYNHLVGKLILQSSSRITAISDFVAKECINTGINTQKLTVIENGIDLSKFQFTKYDELTDSYNIVDEDILLLSVSRLVWYKGFEYVLMALRIIQPLVERTIKYLIIGEPEDQMYYHTLLKCVKKLGLSKCVTITGFISEPKKLQALSRADIFIAPSLHEGFGLILLEAMAYGKPIIASNCEGFQTIVDNMNTGILVEPANAQKIADALIQLLENPKIRSQLATNALKNVKKFDWEERIKAYEILYQTVM